MIYCILLVLQHSHLFILTLHILHNALSNPVKVQYLNKQVLRFNSAVNHLALFTVM